MGRRAFSREIKLEALRLVRDRGVAVTQACRDLDIAESVLRRWMREVAGGVSVGLMPALLSGRAVAGVRLPGWP